MLLEYYIWLGTVTHTARASPRRSGCISRQSTVDNEKKQKSVIIAYPSKFLWRQKEMDAMDDGRTCVIEKMRR
jgi:hypothetical protein